MACAREADEITAKLLKLGQGLLIIFVEIDTRTRSIRRGSGHGDGAVIFGDWIASSTRSRTSMDWPQREGSRKYNVLSNHGTCSGRSRDTIC